MGEMVSYPANGHATTAAKLFMALNIDRAGAELRGSGTAPSLPTPWQRSPPRSIRPAGGSSPTITRPIMPSSTTPGPRSTTQRRPD